jgi:hypothetical protein
MSRGKHIPFVLLIFGGIVLLLWTALGNDRKIDWSERYHPNDLQPFDLNVFYQLLDASTTEPIVVTANAVTTSLAEYDRFNYFYIGEGIYFDTLEANLLLDKIEAGNNAFISHSYIPNDLYYAMEKRGLGELQLFYREASTIRAQLYETDASTPPITATYTHQRNAVDQDRHWNYMDEELVEMETFTPLGSFNTSDSGTVYCNFFRLQIGKGQLYFHTNPILFTNYFIKDSTGFEYVNAIVQHFSDEQIVWEGYHSRYRPMDNFVSMPKSPLKYIFAQAALRYAWFTLLGGFLLFLLFRTKREQRAIPLVAPVENTSIAFAKSLGTLYHRSSEPKYIAFEMIKLFNNFNRRKYNINRSPKDDTIAATIAKKSKVDQKSIEHILQLEREVIYNPSASMKQLIPLHQALERYYQQTKT